MIPEVPSYLINDAIDYGVYAAAAVSAVAGDIVDHLKVRQNIEMRAPLVPEWDIKNSQMPSDPNKQTQTNQSDPNTAAQTSDAKKKRAYKHLAAVPMAALFSIAGTGAAMALLPGKAAPQAEPSVSIDVDHSGATSVSLEGTPPIAPVGEINQVVQEFFVTSKKVNTTGYLASGNTTAYFNNLSEVVGNIPTGGAPLDQALTSSIGQYAQTSKNGTNEKAANAILVVTNGNEAGDPTAMVYQDKTTGNGTPIYIVNVEGNTATNPTTVSNLENIAKKTGGQYWDATRVNINTVSQSVEQAIIPTEQRQPNPNRPIGIMLGVLGSAGSAVYMRMRKYMPLLGGIK